jgi:hypothetical protein
MAIFTGVSAAKEEEDIKTQNVKTNPRIMEGRASNLGAETNSSKRPSTARFRGFSGDCHFPQANYGTRRPSCHLIGFEHAWILDGKRPS